MRGTAVRQDRADSARRAQTGERFRVSIRQIPAPTLEPGDVVIPDNVPAVKGPAVRETIAAIGMWLRFLPCYSSDFRPTENGLASPRPFRRKATGRIIDHLWRAIGQSLDAVTPPNAPTPSKRRL